MLMSSTKMTHFFPGRGPNTPLRRRSSRDMMMSYGAVAELTTQKTISKLDKTGLKQLQFSLFSSYLSKRMFVTVRNRAKLHASIHSSSASKDMQKHTNTFNCFSLSLCLSLSFSVCLSVCLSVSLSRSLARILCQFILFHIYTYASFLYSDVMNVRNLLKLSSTLNLLTKD